MAKTVTGASSTEENKLSATAERLCRRFSLAEIQLATEDFSDVRLIGKGGFGKVYKGLIDNGRETVAVKRLEQSSNQGAAEFCAEIEALTKLRHVNLVSLIGYCNEHEEMILVYEYIARGTLADHLYNLSRNKESDDSSSLTWKQRLKICIGAGRGIDYLHTGSSIIHRDVKSTNILLDENFIAKVSDFGLAKHFSTSSSQSHVSTIVKGSFGYLDPSYFVTCRLTMKSDTYAYGVVLLEVLCGRPAVDPRLTEDKMSLSMWARENISRGKVDEIVASNLKEEILADCLKTFVGVVKSCLHVEPKKRPTMAQAVVQLEFALEQQEGEAATHNVLRFLPFIAFWSRVKPSEALKNKHIPIVARAIPLYELSDVTNNFSSDRLIGEGSNGRVFGGVLKNGQAVVIKKLDYNELAKQVSIISSLQHENLTQLLGYCVDADRQFLAYEFAPNGSLHDILHGRKGAGGSEPSPSLTWTERVKIALGAAKGLEYIHEKGQLHLNMKSSNILIFNGEVAKIADFGLPTEAINGGLSWNDVRHHKTYDYQPPEYRKYGVSSQKSDVYRFGVVLLELLTGCKAIDYNRPGGQHHLVEWARPKLTLNKVMDIVDARLKGNYPPQAAAKMAAVAALCVQHEFELRLDMNVVVRALSRLFEA